MSKIINATYNPRELEAGIAKQKAHAADAVRAYVKEHTRSRPGTTQDLPHTLPLEESYNEDGSTTSSRPTTTTIRKSN